MTSQYSEEDLQLNSDIVVIGKAMLNAVKGLSKESGRPLHQYSQAVIQALIVMYPFITKDDPFYKTLNAIDLGSCNS